MSDRSNEDDTEEKTLALYPKVQIRAFVPRISSLTREGRWSRNQVWPGPSSGHCQVFVAPPRTVSGQCGCAVRFGGVLLLAHL
jgi:hypothetical protein